MLTMSSFLDIFTESLVYSTKRIEEAKRETELCISSTLRDLCPEWLGTHLVSSTINNINLSKACQNLDIHFYVAQLRGTERDKLQRIGQVLKYQNDQVVRIEQF